MLNWKLADPNDLMYKIRFDVGKTVNILIK